MNNFYSHYFPNRVEIKKLWAGKVEKSEKVEKMENCPIFKFQKIIKNRK